MATLSILIVLVTLLAVAATAAPSLPGPGSIQPSVRDNRIGLKHERQVTNRRLERRCRPGRYWPQVVSVWKIPRAVVARRLGWQMLLRRRAGQSRSRCGNPVAVIRLVFGRYGDQAVAVARCETGGTFSVNATNGQYLGLFQMGSWERSTYGHGATALAQSRAAYRYFVASGSDWSPWQCRPWGLAW